MKHEQDQAGVVLLYTHDDYIEEWIGNFHINDNEANLAISVYNPLLIK